jgi:RNA polymerase sigma factor (TIGR02999 family)
VARHISQNRVPATNRVDAGRGPRSERGPGESAQADALVPAVYEQLRRLAKHHLAGQRQGHSLQTVDLVNEAYLRLARSWGAGWSDRAHFVAVASRAMRCVLVDHARRQAYAKRGRNPIRVPLADEEPRTEPGSAEIIAVHEALTRLARIDPRKSQVVELRYFGGLGDEEIAEVMALSARTVKREWRWAKAWLYRELGNDRLR